MPKRIFAVLYVSVVMGLTCCYKTTVFFTFMLRNNDMELEATILLSRQESPVLGDEGSLRREERGAFYARN